jgi:hypothetical protein
MFLLQVYESKYHVPTLSIWKFDESTIVIEFFVLSNG